MGDLGLDGLISYLKLQFGNNSDLDSGTNYYGIWVNLAYKRLTTKNRFWGLKQDFYFPELETFDATQSTTAGTAYVNVPSSALIVRGVWNSTSDMVLDQIIWREYIDHTGRATTAARNKPTEWTRQGGYLYLYPTPDDTYALTIYYRKRVTSLTGTGVTLLGAEWDEPILMLARIIGLQWMNEHEKAAQLKKDWTEMVGELIGIYSEESRASKSDIMYSEF